MVALILEEDFVPYLFDEAEMVYLRREGRSKTLQ